MKKIYFLIIALFLLIGSGCTGSKSYSNKAKKLQAAGMNDEAANFFFQALQRNPKNVDAKIGLKQTGQIRVEKTLTQFYKAYSVTNYKEAVYKYQEALDLKRRYGYFVSVEIPAYYNEYYQEMLVVYLSDRYEVAGDLYYNEKYNEANKIYKEILALDPEYKDVKELSIVSTVEPLYRKGIALFDAEKYRTCYQVMSNVLAQKTMYKEAIDYKERALEEGQIIMAVMGFESFNSSKSNLANSIQGDVITGLTSSNDPFLKVIDRLNTDALIKEQKINVNSSANSAIRAGELLGANMLIKGKLNNYSFSGGKVRMYRKKGFESYRVKRVDEKTKKTYYETKYKRVYYTEYEGSSTVYLEMQYQMISAETGEVVKSNAIRKENTDYVNYISYNGNYKNLYAGKYSGKGSGYNKGDVIYDSYSQKNKLRRLAKNSKKSLKSEQQLASELLNVVSVGIIKGISSYNPDEN